MDRRRGLCILAAFSVFAAGCVAPAANVNPPPPKIPVHGSFAAAFVNVGQGDGVVFTLPDGSIIVYDCGPPTADAAANPVVQYLRSIGVTTGEKIWAVIASHGHLDHIGGCEEVLAEYEVEHIYELWYGGPDAPTSYSRWRDNIAHESSATVHTFYETPALPNEQIFKQGDAVELPQAAFDDGLRATILWPSPVWVIDWDEIGLASLVVRWSFGNIDFCTDGDIELDQETTLAASSLDLNCEVYLVGHHGSRYSSSASWLAKMDPEVAVVSFGTNDYGHPTPEALCRVQTAGANVYATDRLGIVNVWTDGTGLSVTPDHPETANYCAAGASYWPPAPPPPPPPPPPSGAFAVTASASPTNPCQYTTVEVSVHAARGSAAVIGASVTSTWHYKSSDSTVSGTTDSGGNAQLSRYISGAAVGYTVVVEVTASQGSDTDTASTSFTPRAC